MPVSINGWWIRIAGDAPGPSQSRSRSLSQALQDSTLAEDQGGAISQASGVRQVQGQGYVTAATVCHHLDPETKKTAFFDGPFQSVCAPCHDGPIQSEEKTGFSREVGIDGWPTDERHPSNR